MPPEIIAVIPSGTAPEIAAPIVEVQTDMALIIGELKAKVDNLTERLTEAESQCANQKIDLDYLRTDINYVREKQNEVPEIIAEPEPEIIPEPVITPDPEPEPEILPEIEIIHTEVSDVEKEVIKRKRFFV